MSVIEQVVPDGYKQTDVGIIPIDWESSELGSFVQSLDAGVSVNSIDKPDAFSHGLHILKTSCVSNGYFFPREIKSIIPEDIVRAKTIVSKGSIIVSRMNTPDLVGELGYIDKDYPNCFLPDRLWQMRFRANLKTNTRWLAYILSFPVIAKKIKESATGTSNSMKNISKGSLLTVSFPAPSYEEQTAIANALSDIDALLTELEKLIAKKQAIKTATMQQLLTGKTRLPQFATYTEGEKQGQPKGTKSSELGEIPEDWEILSVEECSTKVGSGKTPTGGSSVYVDSGRPFVRSQNVGWGELRIADLSFITEETHNTFKGSEIKLHDVLLNITGASIGRCALASEKVVNGNVNQHVCIIRVNNRKAHPYILQTLINADSGQNQIDSYQAGGNREGLNFSQVKSMKFPFSNNLEEQTAIATILSDIDSEVQTLKQRLVKTRQIKQGMMQGLLTGRTRLPISKEAV